MSVSINQVRFWVRVGGISHVIAIGDGVYHIAICGLFSNGETSTMKPKRICRKCRLLLKDATFTTSASPVPAASPST